MSYSIAGNNFSTYNMQVISSVGGMDFPGRLGEIEHDWKDDNGVEAYVEASDLKWNGRDISLLLLHSGNNLYGDLATFRDLYAGQEANLITHYGAFTVHMKEIRIRQIYRTQQKAVVRITFWEPEVDTIAVPAATGGSGVKLGDYDLYHDFGLQVLRASGFGLYEYTYREKEFSYGDLPKEYSPNREGHRVTLQLAGQYNTTASMVNSVSQLRSYLQTPGTKTLSYQSLSVSVYLADHIHVTAIYKKRVARIPLLLRVAEATQVPRDGQVVHQSDAGRVPMPGAGTIIMPK